MREGPEVTEGAELRLRLDDGLGKNAVRLEGDAVADTAGAHVAARGDHALGPDGGRAFQDDAGIDHRVGPDPHGVVDKWLPVWDRLRLFEPRDDELDGLGKTVAEGDRCGRCPCNGSSCPWRHGNVRRLLRG